MKNNKTKYLSFIVPVLIVLVALVHLKNVNTTELTRWRGGGFGMYTEPNWADNEVWFFGIPHEVDIMMVYEKMINKIRRNPSNENINELGAVLKSKHNYNDFTIEVWKVKYDVKTLTVTKILANEVYIK